MATAALVVSAVSGVASQGAAASAARSDRKARRTSRRVAEFKDAKSRRQTVARSRVLQAEQESQAVNTGVSGGSSFQGAQSSLGTQTADAFSFSQQISAGQDAITAHQSRSNRRLGLANTFQAVSSFSNKFSQ